MAARKAPPRDHPSLDISGSRGTELSGKRIVLCVTGSVAAYKAIRLARLLMRHGADVRCVASGAVTKLIQPEYFRWATGNKVITKLTGELEHIRLADYSQSDMVVVYPATANTLGKLAAGIDDTPVSTVLTVAFGSGIPILVCLAMHASMYGNAAVRRNIEFLEKKIGFVRPRIIEGKAKPPEPEEILEYVLGRFGASSVLKNKRVLITAGGTSEPIDPVRSVTNHSTGRTGFLLAAEMVSAGAKVTVIYGHTEEGPPPGVRAVRAVTGAQMRGAVQKEMGKRYDVIIMAAAVSDYAPKGTFRRKIGSGKKSLTLVLDKTPKIIDGIRKRQKGALLVGFKAEANVSEAALVRAARKKMRESGADIIIANDIGDQYRRNTS